MISIEYAYQWFARQRFPLPTKQQVAALQRRIGVAFPDDYCQFLLEYNGGYFTEPEIIPPDDDFPSGLLTFMHGIGASHPEAELATASDLAIFDDNDPPEVVPIGATPMGNLILIVTHPDEYGAILFKQAFGGSYHFADGIEEFFTLLREPEHHES